MLIIYAATNGFIDQLHEAALKKYEKDLLDFLDNRHPEVLGVIREKREIGDDLRETLNKILAEFGTKFKE